MQRLKEQRSDSKPVIRRVEEVKDASGGSSEAGMADTGRERRQMKQLWKGKGVLPKARSAASPSPAAAPERQRRP